MVASQDGILEFFSLRSDIRDKTENIYRISDYVADGYVQKITKLKGDSKVVAGTVKGNLAVLDFGSAEVYCTLEIAFAHNGGVTGLSSHPTAPSKSNPSSVLTNSFDSRPSDTWVSCSGYDCLLWDKSQALPATRLLNHMSQLTDVHWTTMDENKEHVMLGDELGNVMTVDIRSPEKLLNNLHVSDRGIKGLSFNGTNKFGVVTSNKVKVVQASCSNAKPEVVMEHEANRLLYSMCWDGKDKNNFYVVGDGKTAKKLSIV
jgi:WD40 repeat protein